jgi:hypothetical protein
MTTAKLPAVGATIWLKIEAEIVPITIAEIDSVCIFGQDPKGRLCSAVTSAEGVNWFRTDPRVKPAEASSTTRERLCAFMAERTVNSAEEWGLALWISDVVEWCESEVRLALAPREPSPDLAEAEKWLRAGGFAPAQMARVIAAELDRRAAEIARLTAIVEHCHECDAPTKSPDLAEAKMWLRESSQWFREHGCPLDAGAVILDELDRRAAEIARLTAIVEMASAAPTKEPTT